MRDLYQVRRLLEPAALRSAFPLIDPAQLLAMRDALVEAETRYPDIGIDELDSFENQLHVRIVDSSPNRRLIAALRASQLPLLATNYLLKHYLGTPTEEPFLAEHRLIVELLIQRAPDAAAAALEAHLLSALRKGLSRLEALRASHQPSVPPYLQPIKERRAARPPGESP
jgi:DNA-binding GntR family transcriptional regulator